MVTPEYEYTEFDRWFNAAEEHGLRSERFYNLVCCETDPQRRFEIITQWMTAAFDAGRHPEHRYV
jgi:hypothetical protein